MPIGRRNNRPMQFRSKAVCRTQASAQAKGFSLLVLFSVMFVFMSCDASVYCIHFLVHFYLLLLVVLSFYFSLLFLFLWNKWPENATIAPGGET